MKTMLRTLPTALAFACAGLTTQTAFANNFFDARNTAMGGTGVASTRYSSAGFYNPAMLTKFKEDDDFSINLFTIGAEVSDKDDLVGATEQFVDDVEAFEAELDAQSNASYALPNQNSIDQIKTALTGAGFDPNTMTVAQIQNELTNNPALTGLDASLVAGFNSLVSARDDVINSFENLEGRVGRASIGASLGGAVPSKTLGFSFHINNYTDLGAFVDYDEGDRAIIESAVDSDDLDNLQSSLDVIGFAVTDVGFSFAHEFTVKEFVFSLGVTPKYQRVDTYNYVTKAATFDSDTAKDDYKNDIYRTEDKSVNVDLGFYTDWKKVTVGLFAKNLIAQSYKSQTVDGKEYTYNINPELAAGVAYSRGWFTVSSDLDLIARTGFATTGKNQFARIGGELDVFGHFQVRGGYRYDMKDNRENIATLGFGISPFDLIHFDIAASYGENDTYGGVLQLYGTF